jgi:hypothetical protein
MTENWRTIRLPEDLCRAVEKRYGERFASLEELMTFLLKNLAGPDAQEIDNKDLEIVEQRLKDLGYL